MKPHFRSGLALILLLSLAGCAVGPRYKRPDVPVPGQFKETSPAAAAAPETPAIGYSNWWRVYEDPKLDELESQLGSANLDIRAAIARFDQAEANTKFARSFQAPTVSLATDASRSRESQTRPNTNRSAATFNNFSVALMLGYEVDAWGRVRRTVESSRAVQDASAADVRFVRLAVEATLAIDYFNIRENDAEQEVLQSMIREQQHALDLVTNRFRGGLISELEVKQAQTLLDQTKAQSQALDVQRSQLEHAIAVLVGRPASDFSLPRIPFDGDPPVIPPGLPANILVRRPDIAEADRLLASATANIGVAKAAYFPQISLTGFAGFESTNGATLFSWANSIMSLGTSALTPIFNHGRVRAGVDHAVGVYKESLAQYQRAVLTAYQEVEDQLAALRIMQGEALSQASAVDAARKAEEIATNRYRRGLVSYLDVVFAETTLLGTQRVSTQISGQRMVASVVLIKALGGGWLGVPAMPVTNGSSPATTTPAGGGSPNHH